MSDPDGGRKPRQFDQLLEASSLGLMFPIAIGLGYFWGWGMDKLFHTQPWLTWIFTGFGVIAAFVNLFRIGMRDDGSSG
ncbi:MAG: AtpZ/AtpI family protein [Thermoanaerobaculia bacterium]